MFRSQFWYKIKTLQNNLPSITGSLAGAVNQSCIASLQAEEFTKAPKVEFKLTTSGQKSPDLWYRDSGHAKLELELLAPKKNILVWNISRKGESTAFCPRGFLGEKHRFDLKHLETRCFKWCNLTHWWHQLFGPSNVKPLSTQWVNYTNLGMESSHLNQPNVHPLPKSTAMLHLNLVQTYCMTCLWLF